MVVIVIGATGGYSVIDHSAVEQCGCELMLDMERLQKDSGAGVWRSIDGDASSLESTPRKSGPRGHFQIEPRLIDT